MLKVNILGTPYVIRYVDPGEDAYMDDNEIGGYCAFYSKEIVILNVEKKADWKNESPERVADEKCRTLRHELIHAFLDESGLAWNSFPAQRAWARNEEMVDWFAIQMPKLLEAFRAAGCL